MFILFKKIVLMLVYFYFYFLCMNESLVLDDLDIKDGFVAVFCPDCCANFIDDDCGGIVRLPLPLPFPLLLVSDDDGDDNGDTDFGDGL